MTGVTESFDDCPAADMDTVKFLRRRYSHFLKFVRINGLCRIIRDCRTVRICDGAICRFVDFQSAQESVEYGLIDKVVTQV